MTKGIILAGGTGSRLHPMTLSVSKALIPVYDKPMIYYPLSTLIYSGINEILIISTPHDLPLFKKLLGDGSRIGCKLEYKVQEVPNGLAQAFVIGQEFIGSNKVCLILGDNIFQMKVKILEDCKEVEGGIVFGYHVHDPERYGVVEFDDNFKAISTINSVSGLGIKTSLVIKNSFFQKSFLPSKYAIGSPADLFIIRFSK